MEYENFVRVHGILLAASGLPRSLHKKLHQKLTNDTFDGGQHFQVEEVEVEGGTQRRLVLTVDKLDKECDVFLVDHAWSFRLADARKQLEQMPSLVERMAALMGVAGGVDPDGEEAERSPQSAEAAVSAAEKEAREAGRPVRWLELDECGLDDAALVALRLGERCPELVGLSLWGNNIETSSALAEAVGGLNGLRALWLNENPVCKSGTASALEALHTKLPSLEVLSSHATPGYTLWALGLFASVYGADVPGVNSASGQQRHPLWTVHELDLSGRGLESLKPELFNESEAPTLRLLDLTDNPLSAQDAGELASILNGLPSLVSVKIDVPGPLGATLKEVASVLRRVAVINGLNRDAIAAAKEPTPLTTSLPPRLPTWQAGEPLLERVLRAMWHFVSTYRLATEEQLDETPVWYVMDELGSAVRHSDRPNLVCVPFMYLPDGTLKSAISYSLLWPSEDILGGAECFRDYLRGISEKQQRSSRLTAWFRTPPNYFAQVFRAYKDKLAASKPVAEPLKASEGTVQSILPQDGRPLKVFTDIKEGMDFLSRPEFVQVDQPHEADIVWAFDQIDDAYRAALKVTPEQYVNQFPFEACLVMKHHLADTIKQAHGAPAWVQPTYELDSELPAFIGDFEEREQKGADNLWILKPWNMARSIDSSVTRNLVQVIRSMETGPKIAQKYIERPATFRGRKFDLRLVVLLRSVRPLEVLLYHIFWARFSNNLYTTADSSLDDYETHFTVMNYGRKLENINMDVFVADFEKEHNVEWSAIHAQIKGMLRAAFEGAARVHPEMHDPRARAMYGVDVMLDQEMQPKLLEITYCPDTVRACKYDVTRLQDGKVLLGKDFYNRVFGSLFFREDDGFDMI